jgi:tight adherence protein B
MNGGIFLVLVLVAFGLAEAVYYFVRYLNEARGEALKQRLRIVGAQDAGVQILRRRRLASSATLNELLAGFETIERLEKLLDQTDLEYSVAQVLLYELLFAMLGLGVGAVVRSGLVALALAALGGGLPILVIVQAKQMRARRISDQLPDALEMMARAIKAGHALPSSFKLVAQECPAPVAVEFAKAYEQQNLGLPFEQAVLNMTERVPSNLDLKLFAVSVMIQKETGGNLVEVLESIADTMRERFKFYSKLRALTAEGRISGWILAVLPLAVAFLIFLTNRPYLYELGQGMGRTILVGGIVLWSLGIVWIRRLAQVEY